MISFLLLVACQAPQGERPKSSPSTPETADTAIPGTPTGDTATDRPPPRGPVEITVLYSNDEHGWLEGDLPGRNSANMVATWVENHGYDPDGPFVVLSGGDNWTGPAVSTWFQGESMVEVMNAMGYDAAALGNHEFDFGLDVLTERIDQMTFPMLSANTRRKSDGQVPTDLGVLPYSIQVVEGVRIGIIGLTTRSTPFTTLPDNVATFDFLDYEEALRNVLPEVRNQDVDLVFVPGHVCMYELEPLADAIGDLDVDLLGGGHCNELVAGERNGIVMLEGGSHLRTYAWARFVVEDGDVTEVEWGTGENGGPEEDAGVAAVMQTWQARATAELERQIGYTEDDWSRDELQDLVTEAVSFQYPTVDFYITNRGSVRAELEAGIITVGDLVTVLPFDNTLIEISMTGAQLEALASAHSFPLGGGYVQGGEVYANDGTRVEQDAPHRVLVSSFVYQGGDGYTQLAQFDPNGIDTGVHFRDPVVQWIEAQATTSNSPLTTGALP